MRSFAAFFAGIVFSLGLLSSGMINPKVVLAFLDFGAIGTGGWDPSLAFVMMGALLVAGLGYKIVLTRRAPLFAATFSLSTKEQIDARLIIGAAVFGIGWGLVGYCPGPAIAGIALGGPSTWFFVVAMIVGMFAQQALKPLLNNSTALVAVSATFFAGMSFTACSSDSSDASISRDASDSGTVRADASTQNDAALDASVLVDAAPPDGAITDGAIHDGAASDGNANDGSASDGTSTGDGSTGDAAATDGSISGDAFVGDGDGFDASSADVSVSDVGQRDATTGPAGQGNPQSVGYGVRKTINIDGMNTANEWGSDTLLIVDPAADDARFLGTNWCAHEAPWDYVALHAAWDDQNLYVGIQFVNITDVLDPANLGSSEGSQIHGMDLVQFLAFNTVDGAGYSTGGDMWGKDQTFVGNDHPDFQLYFHSNFSQQGTYFGRFNGTALVGTTDGHLTAALKGKGGEFFVGASLMGVDPHGDDTTPGQYGAASIDYIADRGHQTRYDTFFELQIPLELLEITSSRLASGTIGLFAANGDGSAVDSIPDDPATRSTPGTSQSNSPLEWDRTADDDAYSVPFAWVGTPR